MATSEDRSAPKGAGLEPRVRRRLVPNWRASKRSARWLEDNREAFESANKEFDRCGPWLSDLLVGTDSSESLARETKSGSTHRGRERRFSDERAHGNREILGPFGRESPDLARPTTARENQSSVTRTFR